MPNLNLVICRVKIKGETASYIKQLGDGGDSKTKIEVDSDSKVKVSVKVTRLQSYNNKVL